MLSELYRCFRKTLPTSLSPPKNMLIIHKNTAWLIINYDTRTICTGVDTSSLYFVIPVDRSWMYKIHTDHPSSRNASLSLFMHPPTLDGLQTTAVAPEMHRREKKTETGVVFFLRIPNSFSLGETAYKAPHYVHIVPGSLRSRRLRSHLAPGVDFCISHTRNFCTNFSRTLAFQRRGMIVCVQRIQSPFCHRPIRRNRSLCERVFPLPGDTFLHALVQRKPNFFEQNYFRK